MTIMAWGYRSDLWDKAKAEARGILEQIAKAKGGPIFYSELSRRIAAINFQPDGHDFHGLLGQLSEESDLNSKGLLSALVVHKEDGRPGRGFFVLAKELGRDVSNPEACWVSELDLVYRRFA
jgi:hypothetical protein